MPESFLVQAESSFWKGDRRQRLIFAANVSLASLRLDRLVQFHRSSGGRGIRRPGELVHDDDFAILHHVGPHRAGTGSAP